MPSRSASTSVSSVGLRWLWPVPGSACTAIGDAVSGTVQPISCASSPIAAAGAGGVCRIMPSSRRRHVSSAPADVAFASR